MVESASQGPFSSYDSRLIRLDAIAQNRLASEIQEIRHTDKERESKERGERGEEGVHQNALADILRLPDETLAMSYLYRNKYLRFHRSSDSPDPLDPISCDKCTNPLPSHPQTLSLSTLSLSSKSTESPRRLSSILLPAYTLLHSDTKPPLKSPSPTYDTLRATLVQAELILLRVLGFELHLPSPLEYLQRYLERAMEDVESVGEEFDAWEREAKDEYGVLGGMIDGRMGRGCRGMAVDACKDYQLANLFPARAVALAVVWVVLADRGLRVEKGLIEWVKDVGSDKIDVEDFEEVVEILRKL
ncbi:MAG: hypothetical protein Q9166_004163 [cf. Caloplaca sp. 2 TL-2023]